MKCILKKYKRDPRINVKHISAKEYWLLFFLLAAFNGFHMWLYQAFVARGVVEVNTRYVINVLMIYVMGITMCITTIVGWYRHIAWNRPVQKVGEAVRKIASGDFSHRITPLRKDGKKDHIEVMFDDINTMTHELQSIEILKNDFIADVSHEIKTPLSVIQNYVAALKDDRLSPEDRRNSVETIMDASQKLSLLVSNILKLNKLENQEIHPNARPFDLTEQIRRCAVAFEDAWERKSISVEVELEEVTVCHDEEMLEIVWNNLLSNAVKFTDPHGSIHITLLVKDGNARVSISNTGAGMDEPTQRHVFDKFYQGDASRHREGNGLGLALAKRAVDLSGGTIGVESRLGHGAVFTVCLGV